MVNTELNFDQTTKTMLVLPYRYLPSTFRLYTPALARQIARKTPRARHFTAVSTPTTSRPYTFHLGVSWAGKPEDPALEAKIPFPPDTLIGAWRDRMLMHPKSVKSVDAGEDFFFIQRVRYFGVAVYGLLCNISIDTLRGDHLLTSQLSL